MSDHKPQMATLHSLDPSRLARSHIGRASKGTSMVRHPQEAENLRADHPPLGKCHSLQNPSLTHITNNSQSLHAPPFLPQQQQATKPGSRWSLTTTRKQTRHIKTLLSRLNAPRKRNRLPHQPQPRHRARSTHPAHRLSQPHPTNHLSQPRTANEPTLRIALHSFCHKRPQHNRQPNPHHHHARHRKPLPSDEIRQRRRGERRRRARKTQTRQHQQHQLRQSECQRQRAEC